MTVRPGSEADGRRRELDDRERVRGKRAIAEARRILDQRRRERLDRAA